MSASPSRKRPRRSAESAPIAPPPGMGFDPAPSAPPPPASLVPPPPPSTTTFTTVPPPPPVGAPPATGATGAVPPPPPPASSMSADAAKAAAQRAASRVHASLGMISGGPTAIDPARYPGMPPGWGAGMTEAQRDAAYHQHTRQSRRLYVGNLPKRASPEDIVKFFNDAMLASGAATRPDLGDPVLAANANLEKGFAFVEFRLVEDAESALAFDGVVFENANINVRRPNDYDPSKNPLGPGGVGGGPVVGAADATLGAAAPGGGGSHHHASSSHQKNLIAHQSDAPIGTIADPTGQTPPVVIATPALATDRGRVPRRVPDGPNKLYVGGFDPLHAASQIRATLEAVGGPLKSFAVMPDARGAPTGHAFFEYQDARLTRVAEEALTGIRPGPGPGRLACRRTHPAEEEEEGGGGGAAAAKKKEGREGQKNASASAGKEKEGSSREVSDAATYEIPRAAIPMLESPSDLVWVYNAVCASHDAVEAGEVEDAIRREAARLAAWAPDRVRSARAHPDGRVTLAFEPGGGDGSGTDAAARAVAGIGGVAFEGRTLWARFAPRDKENKDAGEEEGLGGGGGGVIVAGLPPPPPPPPPKPVAT